MQVSKVSSDHSQTLSVDMERFQASSPPFQDSFSAVIVGTEFKAQLTPLKPLLYYSGWLFLILSC